MQICFRDGFNRKGKPCTRPVVYAKFKLQLTDTIQQSIDMPLVEHNHGQWHVGIIIHYSPHLGQ